MGCGMEIFKKIHPALAVFFLGILVFIPSLNFDFVYDDLVEIRQYEELFTKGPWYRVFATAQARRYRPVKHLSLNIDYALWKWRPAGFHLTNLILHGAVCALLYFFLFRVSSSRSGSFLGAAWFALHPVHTESVAWISARGSMLAGVGVSGFLLFYLRWREKGRPRDIIVAGLFALLGYFGKENALMAIPALALVEIYVSPSHQIKNLKNPRFRIGMAVAIFPAILYLGLRMFLLRGFALEAREGGFAMWLATLPEILVRYFGKTIYPATMTVEYPAIGGGFGLFFWGSTFFCLLAILSLGVRNPAFRPWKLFLAWFFIFLIPVLGIVAINQQMADRFLYLPSMAGAFFVACLWKKITEEKPGWKKMFLTVWGALLFFFVLRILFYLPVWKNEQSLWTYTVKVNPGSYRAWNNLAALDNNGGRFSRGLERAKRSLRIKPDHIEAMVSQAYALDRLGRKGEAEEVYRKAAAMNPAYTPALFAFADLLERMGKLQESEEMYDRIFKLRPGFVDARIAAGVLCMKMGKKDRAVFHWKKALETDPENALARQNLKTAGK